MNHVLFQGFGAIPKAASLPSNAPDDEARRNNGTTPVITDWNAPHYPSSSRNNNNNNNNASLPAAAIAGSPQSRAHRRLKRKRLQNYCRKRKNKISFIDILDVDLSCDEDESSSSSSESGSSMEDEAVEHQKPSLPEVVSSLKEQDTEPRQQRVVIDVDKLLGLQGSLLHKYHTSRTKAEDDDEPNISSRSLRRNQRSRRRKAIIPLTPKELGYYEGVVDLSLPEDSLVLSRQQVWIREQLQLFSVTPESDSNAMPGQRRSMTPGRVGVRCRHCSSLHRRQVQQQKLQLASAERVEDGVPDAVASSSSLQLRESQNGNAPVPGVISTFPNTVSLLYSACTQRTSSLLAHIEACPNLPAASRQVYDSLLSHQQSNTRGRTSGGGISASSYYAICARRLGLVDDTSAGGIRFGRDLSIAPLPWDTIRRRVQVEAAGGSYENGNNSKHHGGTNNSASSAAVAMQPRIQADEESERVLAQAVMQGDDDMVLGKSSDKELVSDFVFLGIRQMAVCNAETSDFTVRGKKSRFLRLGLAGFCCRHCRMVRSFPSAADNLSSAISNAFTTHLFKCPYARDISKALANYKRLHSRQMSMLPYGSQRKCFQALWDRLRDHDKSEEEMANMAPEPKIDLPLLPPVVTNTVETIPTTVGTDALAATSSASSGLGGFQTERPFNFPQSGDEVTQQVLQAALEKWEPEENDMLLLREDRALISDYLFLAMRQMKLAIPDAADQARMRGRSVFGIPGLCCIHCDGKPAVTPSGRTFPSAPDHFASALNSSLFGHLKACPYLPAETRHALVSIKKLHSPQCSSLKFGSQRRFFTMLFARLRELGTHAAPPGTTPAAVLPRVTSAEARFDEYGFLLIPNNGDKFPMLYCKHCRMVPIQFRAPHSVVSGRKALETARKHASICHKDQCDFSHINQLLSESLMSMCSDVKAASTSVEFYDFVDQVFGGDTALRESIFKEGDLNQKPWLVGSVWHRFPLEVDCKKISLAFARFRRVHSRETSQGQIAFFPNLMKWILMVAPGFDATKVDSPVMEGLGPESDRQDVTAGQDASTKVAKVELNT